jgi:hypothetical protein
MSFSSAIYLGCQQSLDKCLVCLQLKQVKAEVEVREEACWLLSRAVIKAG